MSHPRPPGRPPDAGRRAGEPHPGEAVGGHTRDAILPGLCSVTFRKLPAEEVLRLAAEAGLAAVEWGGDVHLPPGETTRARELGRRTRDAGLATPSYGSYFVAGRTPPEQLEPVLDTALALGAAVVRVWTPLGTRPDAPPAERSRIAGALRDAVDRATARRLRLALEFHPGTLTETAASALALLDETDRPALGCYWQPSPAWPRDRALAELRALGPRLVHLHVFAWEGTPPRRLPLAAHEALWRPALAHAATLPADPPPRCAYLEFVRDDDPALLAREAEALAAWIREMEKPCRSAPVP